MRIYTDKEKQRALTLAMELANAIASGKDEQAAVVIQKARNENLIVLFRKTFSELARGFRASLKG